MTVDRDPSLESLFEIAKQDLSGEAFTAQLMSRIDRLRRRLVIGWSCVGLVLVLCAWLIAAPLQDAVPVVTRILPSTLVDLDNSRLAQIFAPVNSIGGLVAFGLIGLRTAYRKIFS